MIEVLICTIDERINNAARTINIQRPDVCYLISWQISSLGYPQRIPPIFAHRNDVRVSIVQGKGLSANRNNALQNAKGDILVISDDDCTYTNENFDTIIKAYDENPNVDIMAFQACDEFGKPLKSNYSTHGYTYEKRPFASSISSCEITMRRNGRIPQFDIRFGLGSEYLSCGEEEIFLHQAYFQGLKIQYSPYTIVKTKSGTTGDLFAIDPGVRRSKGAVLRFIHGYLGALLRSIKFSLIYSRFHPIRSYTIFKDLYSGIQYIGK